MTTESASARPYSVTFDALYLHRTLILGTDVVLAVDNGLSPDEKNELTLPGKRRTITWINKLASVFVLLSAIMLVSVGAVYLFADAGHHTIAVAGSILGLVVATGFFWAHIRGGQIRRELQASSDRLTSSGRLTYWPDIEPAIRTDLTRVVRALKDLQERNGSTYDNQAREAVAAVLSHDSTRPREAVLAIARSTSDDPETRAARPQALADTEAWASAVAKAENRITALEEAAGLGTRR